MAECDVDEADQLSALLDMHMKPVMKQIAEAGFATIVIAAGAGKGGARSYLSNMTYDSARVMLQQALERLDLAEQSERASVAKA